MLRPVSVDDTESGRYDLVIRATDQGTNHLFELMYITLFCIAPHKVIARGGL